MQQLRNRLKQSLKVDLTLSFLKYIKDKYAITISLDATEHDVLKALSFNAQGRLMILLSSLYNKNPLLLDAADKGPENIKCLIKLVGKYDSKALLKIFEAVISRLPLFVDDLEHFEKLIHLMMKFNDEVECKHFSSLLHITINKLDSKDFYEALESLPEKPECLEPLIEIINLLDYSISEETIKDLFYKDHLTLHYILDSINILSKANVDSFQANVLLDQANLSRGILQTYSWNTSLCTKGSLFTRLIILSILTPHSKKVQFLTEHNLVKIFGKRHLFQEPTPIYDHTAMWRFFLNIIEHDMRNTLTQSTLDQLLRDLEKNNTDLQTDLKDLPIEKIANHFYIPIDSEIREDYEALGKNWWASAFYNCLPESVLLRITQGYKIQLDLNKKDIYPVLASGISETQEFLKCIDLLNQQAKTLFDPNQKGLENFSRLISLAEKYTFLELYKVFQLIQKSLKNTYSAMFPEIFWNLAELMHSFNTSDARNEFLEIFYLLSTKLSFSSSPELDKDGLDIDSLKGLLVLKDREESFPLLRESIQTFKSIKENSYYLNVHHNALFLQNKHAFQSILAIIQSLSEAGLTGSRVYDQNLSYVLNQGSFHSSINSEIALATQSQLLSALNNSPNRDQILSQPNYERLFKGLRNLASHKKFNITPYSPLLIFIPQLIQDAQKNKLTGARFEQILEDVENFLRSPNHFTTVLLTSERAKQLIKDQPTREYFCKKMVSFFEGNSTTFRHSNTTTASLHPRTLQIRNTTSHTSNFYSSPSRQEIPPQTQAYNDSPPPYRP
jgi:hypothetical protein